MRTSVGKASLSESLFVKAANWAESEWSCWCCCYEVHRRAVCKRVIKLRD